MLMCSSFRRIMWSSNVKGWQYWVNIVHWQQLDVTNMVSVVCMYLQSVGFYQGLQRMLLTEVFSLVMLGWRGELSWREPASVSLVSEDDWWFWKSSSSLLLDCVFTASLDRKWTISWTHLEWPWLAADEQETESPWQYSMLLSHKFKRHLQDVCFLHLGVRLLFEELWTQQRLELLNAAVDSLSA